MNTSFKKLVKELNHGVDERKKLEEYKSLVKSQINNDVTGALKDCEEALVIAEEFQNYDYIGYFTLLKGACYNYLSQYDTAENLIQQAISIFSEKQDKKALASAYLNLGLVNIYKKDYKRALANCIESSRYNSADNNPALRATLFNNFGVVYFNIEEHEKALKYFLDSIKLSKEVNDVVNLERCFVNIGLIYKSLKDYNNALKYYKSALEILLQMKDKMKEANLYQNFSELYFDKNELTKSLEYCDKSIKLYEELGEKSQLASNHLFKGKICNEIGDSYNALTQCNLSLLIWDRLNNEVGLAETKSLLAELYYKGGNIDKAINLAYDSTLIATRKNLNNILYANYEFLSKIFQEKKDFESSMLYKEKQFQKYKEIHAKEIDKITNNLMIQFEVEKLDYETKKLKEEKTHLTLLNEKLESLNKEKNEFIGILAHDLRNPLGAIYSLAEIYLGDGEGLDPDQKEIMQEIKISSDKMLNLISNLLNLNAIESGTIEGKISNVNLSELVSRIIKENTNAAIAKGISISVSKPDFEIKLNSYKVAIEQILTNILTNAIKYTFPNKNVFIGVYENKENEPVCEIMDEGPGFTEKDKEVMFKKFAKLSAKPTGGENSVGLGLSIVKKLADLTGARIHVESTLGKGAKFVVIFKNFVNE